MNKQNCLFDRSVFVNYYNKRIRGFMYPQQKKEVYMKNTETNKNGNGGKSRRYLSQTDVPGYSLEQAMRIPRAISDNYALAAVTPIQLAAALDMSPTSGGWPLRFLIV